MPGLQGAGWCLALLDDQESAQHLGSTGTEEVLQVLPQAHGFSRDALRRDRDEAMSLRA